MFNGSLTANMGIATRGSLGVTCANDPAREKDWNGAASLGTASNRRRRLGECCTGGSRAATDIGILAASASCPRPPKTWRNDKELLCASGGLRGRNPKKVAGLGWCKTKQLGVMTTEGIAPHHL